jgi:hypothetical protein
MSRVTAAATRGRDLVHAAREDPWLPAVVGCGVLLVLVLFTQWGVAEGQAPSDGLNAWERYPNAAIGLLVIGVVAVGGALAGGKQWRGAAVLAAGLGTVAVIAALMLARDPGRGAWMALVVGAALIALGARELPNGHPGATRAWRLLMLSPVLAIPLTLAAFPTAPLAPGGGTDGSWITALHVGAQRGLDWGTDLVYTYGPLGYLTVPRLYYATQGTLAVLYVALAYYALAVVILAAARRSFPLPIAIGLAFFTSSAFRLISPDETTQFAVVAIAFCLGLAALRDPAIAKRRWYPAALAAAGFVAAFHALIKLNAGLTVVLIGFVVAACGRPGRRLKDVAVFGGALAISIVLIWVTVAGQALGSLPDYLRYSAEIINGFAGYQYTEEGGREWEYLALPLVLLAVGVTLWEGSRSWPFDRRLGAAALTALVAFSLFKQGFVRHDGHSFGFFAVMLAVGVGIGWSRRSATGLVAAALLMIAFLGAVRPLPYEFVRVQGTLDLVREHFRILRDPEPFIAQERENLRNAEAIDAETLALLRGHSVHFYPAEAAIAWAYPGLRWKPLPVFQGFTAYTSALDELNAAALGDPDAPERLLRSKEYSPFEDPEASVEVLCRYVELRKTARWQVLGRIPNRCGPARSLGRVATHTEESLTPPRPGPREIVAFRVTGFGIEGAERLRSFLYKPYAHEVLLDDQTAARLAPTLGGKRNVIAVGREADYSPGWRFDLGVSAIRFRLGGEAFLGPQGFKSRDLAVEWVAIPVNRPGQAPTTQPR